MTARRTLSLAIARGFGPKRARHYRAEPGGLGGAQSRHRGDRRRMARLSRCRRSAAPGDAVSTSGRGSGDGRRCCHLRLAGLYRGWTRSKGRAGPFGRSRSARGRPRNGVRHEFMGAAGRADVPPQTSRHDRRLSARSAGHRGCPVPVRRGAARSAVRALTACRGAVPRAARQRVPPRPGPLLARRFC